MSGMQSGCGRRRLVVSVLCIALSGLALLLWSRLKLVTGVPRTAYADPSKQVEADRGEPGRSR